jgi:hypothetical protein
MNELKVALRHNGERASPDHEISRDRSLAKRHSSTGAVTEYALRGATLQY